MQLLGCNLHTSYSKLLPVSVNFWVATMLSWVIEEWNEADFRFLDLPAQKLGFYFWKKKHSLAPQIILSNLSFLLQYLTKAKLLPSFFLPSNQAYVELRVGIKKHVWVVYIVKSKTRPKQKNKSYNLIKRCKCVEFFLWIVDELFCMIYLSPCNMCVRGTMRPNLCEKCFHLFSVFIVTSIDGTRD